MSLLLKGNWEILKLNKNYLSLEKTLFSGQSFIWNIVDKSKESTELKRLFIGTIKDDIIVLKESTVDNDFIEYKFISKNSEINDNTKRNEEQRKDILKDYFNLKYDFNEFLKEWKKDSTINNNNNNNDNKKVEEGKEEEKTQIQHSLNKQFCETYEKFIGLRLIRQNPMDCLFSFICSQNNNIGRISKMVKNLLSNYGTLINEIDGERYYSFPTIEQLQTCTESKLNELGFGYRSKYIKKSAEQIKEKGGDTWLMNLRMKSHQEAHKELQSLMGVGQKVADCVCLFSLDKYDIVPIDTHIFKISQKHMPSLSKKKLNPTIYQQIRDFWKERFGSQAGWAHTLLFANEISHFKRKLEPTTIPIKEEKEDNEEEDDKEEEEEEKQNDKEPKIKKIRK